jgi:hypothetical protein
VASDLVGRTGFEPAISSVSGQAARVVACAQLGTEQCEWSGQVQGRPTVCTAIVTQFDTQFPSDAVMGGQRAHGSGGGWQSGL